MQSKKGRRDTKMKVNVFTHSPKNKSRGTRTRSKVQARKQQLPVILCPKTCACIISFLSITFTRISLYHFVFTMQTIHHSKFYLYLVFLVHMVTVKPKKYMEKQDRPHWFASKLKLPLALVSIAGED
ncbi:hypothetical protein V8G54_021662 [Vigna mungo]|uniref:Uncharacterized protein n=1 Tax=Vigna mungo TaxID=3915 RepID=A0AAQ3NG03_VIGMU